ncbi:NAD(P)H-binding protein, partial [[Kitasatospora] papulosa]|uniref:NAD(P)H-binding protein n=1 Tax=[Kitasatospora] papulosa TaxID=1464011 RepID=UPI0036A321DB
MILVTGAVGTVGREVVRCLPAGLSVRIMARDPAKVTGAAPTAETVVGHHGDPASVTRALAGVTTAFLVTSRLEAGDDDRFVEAAKRAGVQRLVKLSAAAVTDPGADDRITRWQRANERLLRESGLEWTLLRPRAFMSNTLSWAPSVRSEGVVRALYGNSASACVDPRDIAECAVRTLAEEGHAGRAYTLTGPEATTAVEQTRHLGRLLGIPLHFEELSPDQARAALSRRYPDPVVEALLESAERQRQGRKEEVHDTVRVLTGRPSRSFRVWAEDHLEAFAPDADTTETPRWRARTDPRGGARP